MDRLNRGHWIIRGAAMLGVVLALSGCRNLRQEVPPETPYYGGAAGAPPQVNFSSEPPGAVGGYAPGAVPGTAPTGLGYGAGVEAGAAPAMSATDSTTAYPGAAGGQGQAPALGAGGFPTAAPDAGMAPSQGFEISPSSAGPGVMGNENAGPSPL